VVCGPPPRAPPTSPHSLCLALFQSAFSLSLPLPVHRNKARHLSLFLRWTDATRFSLSNTRFRSFLLSMPCCLCLVVFVLMSLSCCLCLVASVLSSLFCWLSLLCCLRLVVFVLLSCLVLVVFVLGLGLGIRFRIRICLFFLTTPPPLGLK